MVVAGVTTTDVPDNAPGFHVYVKPPAAVNVEELPLQKVVGDPTALTVGFGFTFKVKVVVFEHGPLEPVTV